VNGSYAKNYFLTTAFSTIVYYSYMAVYEYDQALKHIVVLAAWMESALAIFGAAQSSPK
jgi:hypothetical protein